MENSAKLGSEEFARHFHGLWRSMMKLFKLAQRETELEIVHRLRVQSREMESVLQLFRFALGPGDVRPCLRWVKQLRRAARRVRDLDVQVALIQYIWGSTNESENLQELVDFLLVERKRCAVKMRRRLGKLSPELLERDFSRLQDRLGRFLKHGPAAPFVSRYLNTLLRAQQMDQECVREVVISDEMHDLRLQLKQLRFMGQFLSTLGQVHLDSQAFEAIRRFHRACGYLNDAEQLNRSFDRFCAQSRQPNREFQLRILARLMKYRNSLRADLMIEFDWTALASLQEVALS